MRSYPINKVYKLQSVMVPIRKGSILPRIIHGAFSKGTIKVWVGYKIITRDSSSTLGLVRAPLSPRNKGNKTFQT